MKIIKKPDASGTFGNLNEGDVFKYLGTYYMRTNIVTSGTQDLNAVILNTGLHTWFHDDKIVTPVNGAFVEDYEEETS